MKLSSIKENLFALVIAFVLALWVVFVINKTDFLKADIMNEKAQQKIQSELSYEIKDWKLSVISNKAFDGVLSLSLYVIYDGEKVKISKEDVDSDYEFWLSQAGEWRMNIILTNVWWIAAWAKLLDIKFTWDDSSINLSDITVKFTDEHWENITISSK